LCVSPNPFVYRFIQKYVMYISLDRETDYYMDKAYESGDSALSSYSLLSMAFAYGSIGTKEEVR